MNNAGLGPLISGSKVVVIGGGPGGVSTAISIKSGARRLGREIQVIIVEGKRFQGEQHYNQCTGVLSPPIIELIERQLCTAFPYSLQRAVISGYVLHTPRSHLVLDGKDDPAISLRRVQFDAYMLESAQETGVQVSHARLTGLELHADKVIAYTEGGSIDADLIVGAFGLDEGTATIFARAVGYRPPPALASIVTKFHPGEAGMQRFGERIHAFLPAQPQIEFGAISPKGNHLTINIAGSQVDATQMDAFLSAQEVQRELPNFAGRFTGNPEDFRYYKGQFPSGLAGNFSGDRFVIVGDAAGLVRAFKGKGVTSAIQTGIRAAEVCLCQGISAAAWKAYQAANQDILEDLPYARAMRHFVILTARFGLMDPILRAAESDQDVRKALFAAVSGSQTYRTVLRSAFKSSAVRAMLKAFAQNPGTRV